MNTATIRSLKTGEYFKRKPDSKIVWVRNKYIGKYTYSAYKFDDVNCEKMFQDETIVYVDFTF